MNHLPPFFLDPALLAHPEWLASLIEAMPGGLLLLDEEGRHLASNREAREMLQLPDALLSQARATLPDRPELQVSGEAGPVVRGPGGQWLQVQARRLPNGWELRSLRDVTQERAKVQRLELALQAAGMGLWEYTPHDDLAYLSPGWQQILGYPPKPRVVTSRDLVHLSADGNGKTFHAALIDLLRGATPHFCIEHEAVKASGATIWLQSEAQVAERDEQGRALRVVGTTKNITERKTEQRAMEAAVLAAERANRARAEFLATVSHEIRTPLNGVIGLARVLGASELPAREAGYAGLINSCATTLLGMVNDVLDFSKIDAGQMVLEPAACELRVLVEEVSALFGQRARDKGLEFQQQVASGVPGWVMVDAQRLRQILFNLLGNALKFTTSGSIGLAVSTGHLAHQASLRFEVSDTGLGIAPQDQAKLFKRFSQVDGSSTRRFQGTGLGLAISRDLAVLMGGDIRVSSAPGNGSTFTLEIPLMPTGEQPAPRVQPPAGAGLSILLVEDNPINQLVAQALLEKLGYQDVTVAENGEQALRCCEERSFSLVLMDCQMPVMDGFEATRRLRAGGRHMPIIALTAGAVSDDRERCLACGMNDYLAKPIDAGLLGTVLETWLSLSPTSDAPT